MPSQIPHYEDGAVTVQMNTPDGTHIHTGRGGMIVVPSKQHYDEPIDTVPDPCLLTSAMSGRALFYASASAVLSLVQVSEAQRALDGQPPVDPRELMRGVMSLVMLWYRRQPTTEG